MKQFWKRSAGVALAVTLAALGCESPPRLESQTPFELGRDAARIKDYATAVAQLTVAINNARDYVFTEAYLERGECQLRKASSTEDPTERELGLQAAFDDVSVVLKEDKLPGVTRARALALQGRTLLEKRDSVGAQQAFERIIELELELDDWAFLLVAHRELGRIFQARALAGKKADETALDEMRAQDEFLRAQRHFSRGLEIDADDPECNLGKGICLRYRGQDRDAIRYLARNTALSDARGGINDPRGHFHLGLALELQKGYQEKALEHFRRAAEQDSLQTFTPLYAHLVQVLLVYVPFEDPQFSWFFDKMLAFSGDDAEYWTSLENLADELARGTSSARKEAGLFARAVARARIAKIDAAVADALALSASPTFVQILARVFPIQPRRPELLYGRALALFGAGRHEELATFFEDPVFRLPDPNLVDNEHFRKAQVIEGKNIIALWLARDISKIQLTDQQKAERDNYLARAITIFQTYLSRYADDRDITLAMGEAQELTDEPYKASQSYARIGKSNPEDADAFRRLTRLHNSGVLNAQQSTEAWIALLGYTGNDEEILAHLQRTGLSLRSQALQYCTGCGRKGAEGDVLCQECGRQIGNAAAKNE